MRNFIFSLLALILLPSYMSGQGIKGKVLDETGNSLPGVNVRAVSSTSVTITDFDGNFSIAANSGDQLEFSYLGYETVVVSASPDMVVNLKPGSTDLSEVIVVGYGTQRKADVTGAIAVVNEKDLRDRPNASPIASLQGKVAGVTITNSGAPGSQPFIDIRGVGSASGRDILYVVDGVLTGDISYINPSDIASMSILKDASSSAIYGIRAANGVIVITTKTGKKGEENIKFNYDAFVGVQKTTNVPEFANAADYVRLYNEKLEFEGSTSDPLVLSDFNGVDTDWFDEVLRKSSFTTSHNLNISGASSKSIYGVSLGYFEQEGLLEAGKGVSSGEDFKRISARITDIYNVTDRFRIGGTMAHTKSNSNDAKAPFFVARITPPVIPVYNPDGTYAINSDLGTAGNNNPRFVLDNFRGKTENSRTIVNGFGEYDIIANELTFKLSYSRDFKTTDKYEFTPEFTTLGTTTLNPSKLIKTNEQRENILVENTLTWTKTFNKHRFVLLAGASREKRTENFMSFSVLDVPFNGDDSTLYLNLGNPATLDNLLDDDGDVEGNDTRFQSYFGRLQYAYDDKYLLNATVRRDGASVYNFDGDQKTATFPSIGIGWVISKEAFMANSGIDFLKLKASWGELGNATITRQFDERISTQTPGFFGIPSTQYQAGSVTQLVDTSISWEVVEGTDVGVELRAMRNRLSVEAVYYNKETKDAIFNVTNSPVSGLGGSLFTNAGSFENKGFEFNVGWNDKVGDKWTYSVYGNLTTIDNQITDVLGGSFFNTGLGLFGNTIKRYEVGQELGAYYGFQVEGVVQTQAEADEYGSPIGALRFEDRDGNGVIDDQDKTFLGSPIPDITYGFGFNLGYVNFDLGMEFQGVAGNEIYNFNRNSRFGNENWDQDFVDNHWTLDNPSNTYPAANSDQTSSRPSSFYVEEGDYFRIRQIQLGYTLPKSFLDRIKLDRLRLYVSAQNPFTAFDYNGFSPEMGNQRLEEFGVDNNNYPLSATYTFGINLNF